MKSLPKISVILLLTLSSICAASSMSASSFPQLKDNQKKGLLITIDMLNKDSTTQGAEWRQHIPLLSLALTNHIDAQGLATLTELIYNPSTNAPSMVGELASIGAFLQTGDVRDILDRLQSNDQRLVETALGTADVMTPNAEYRDLLYSLIRRNAETSNLPSLIPLYFALRNYTHPDDIDVLQQQLRNLNLSAGMKQVLFRALVDGTTTVSNPAAYHWVRELFLAEPEVHTFRVMTMVLNEESPIYAQDLKEEKRRQLRDFMRLLDPEK